MNVGCVLVLLPPTPGAGSSRYLGVCRCSKSSLEHAFAKALLPLCTQQACYYYGHPSFPLRLLCTRTREALSCERNPSFCLCCCWKWNEIGFVFAVWYNVYPYQYQALGASARARGTLVGIRHQRAHVIQTIQMNGIVGTLRPALPLSCVDLEGAQVLTDKLLRFVIIAVADKVAFPLL